MGGEPAFTFELPESVSSSSGFLKVFVSTVYLDLAWLEQKMSPFDPLFEGKDRNGGLIPEKIPEVPKWDAFNVLLTMTAAVD